MDPNLGLQVGCHLFSYLSGLREGLKFLKDLSFHGTKHPEALQNCDRPLNAEPGLQAAS